MPPPCMRAEALAKIPNLSLTVSKVTQGVGGKVAVVYTRESGSTVVEVFRWGSAAAAWQF